MMGREAPVGGGDLRALQGLLRGLVLGAALWVAIAAFVYWIVG